MDRRGRNPEEARRSPRPWIVLVLALSGGPLLACAQIAALPELSLATPEDASPEPGADATPERAADARTDAGADAGADAGPRCWFDDAFERDVVELGSLNVRGTVTSVQLTADEQLAAVSSFVSGLGSTTQTSWAVFTLRRQPSGLYEDQRQEMVGAYAALREDGLAMVVVPSSDGRGPLKEYGRPRLDAAFGAIGEISALSAYYEKHHPIYVGSDALFLDAQRTGASPMQLVRLTRSGGVFQGPEVIEGLPAAARNVVPTRDMVGLYFSTCSADQKCTPYRARSLRGLEYGAVEVLFEVGADFRPRWVSHDGCRLYGTRASRPVMAVKLPR